MEALGKLLDEFSEKLCMEFKNRGIWNTAVPRKSVAVVVACGDLLALEARIKCYHLVSSLVVSPG